MDPPDKQQQPPTARQVHDDVSRMLPQCQMRGLNASASWLAELADSAAASGGAAEDAAAAARAACELIAGLGAAYGGYCLAKSYLDRGEYQRACAHARRLLGSPQQHPVLYFLHLYAKYRASEKRLLDDEAELRWLQTAATASAAATAAALGASRSAADGGAAAAAGSASAAGASARNDLIEVKRELEIRSRRGGGLDAYCYYLYALVLKSLGYREQAASALTAALAAEPCLWPAWAMLADMVVSRQELEQLTLPGGGGGGRWMRQFFLAAAYTRLHESQKAEAVLQELLGLACGFAGSAYLLTQLGIVKDQQRAIGEAKQIFKQLFEADRCALDAADVYSNILYVDGNHSLLADLAHQCVLVDKYKPETCCVVGNYYGLRGSHDKALSYFQRALRLRPDYALVWILVGHEYLELKQVSNAVQAYHKAVTFNPADYRGWYGLGHVHELNSKHYYAIYYYRECSRLWSSDPRVMVALGECYCRVGRNEEAKKCFLKAFHVGDPDTMALFRLAELYERLHEQENACNAYLVLLSTVIKSGATDPKAEPAAYKFLAQYYMDRKQSDEASKAAKMCLDYPETKEFGKDMLKQISLRSAASAVVFSAAAVATSFAAAWAKN